MKTLAILTLGVFLTGASFFSGAYTASAAVANWQKGVTIEPRWNTDFSSQTFKQSVSNAAATNADYVTLVVPYYQSNLYTTDIGPGWNTPTDESLIDGINYIHSLGLKVMIKLHMDSNTGEWRANINPSDRSGWFANYGKLLVRLAGIAQQTKTEQFCIGSELINMSTHTSNPDNTQQWNNLISQVREVYSGKLTYSANWGPPPDTVDEKAHIGFWPQLDYAGIAAYYNLNQAPDNSVASLESAWNNWLNSDIQQFANNVKKPLLFTEIGYKSVTGAHNQPWDYNWGGPADQNEQANSYTALFNFWDKQSFMQGVHLWDWKSDPNAGGAGDTGYTPQNKQAQSVMEQWFGGITTTGSGESPSPNPYPTVSCPAPASNAFTGCYFSDQVFTNPSFTRTDQSIDFDWGNNSPDINVPADHFSARWEGNFSLNAGDYTFSVTADDGVKLYIDNQLVLDKWIDQAPTTHTVTKTMPAGTHAIKMEYYENGGGATAKLSWGQNTTSDGQTGSNQTVSCPTPATGAFSACYYSDTSLNNLVLSRTDQSVDFDWAGGSPDPLVPTDRFSARWEGNFNFNAGSQTFSVTADDGVRLYVDNNLVIDKWLDQAPATYQATVNLAAGNHLVKVEYYENGGGAVAKVSWNQDGSGETANPPPSSNITFVNGYPTIDGNYIDCRGNIDNDPAHHTTDSNDTDPAHRIGQSCPAGTLVGDYRPPGS